MILFANRSPNEKIARAAFSFLESLTLGHSSRERDHPLLLVVAGYAIGALCGSLGVSLTSSLQTVTGRCAAEDGNVITC